MGRQLTFGQLKTEKGWPHSRQWTRELVKDGKMPAPRKRPGGGSLNLWDEDEWDAYYASFISAFPQPIQATLTTTLIEALSTTSIDGVMNAIERLRGILEHEGADASDVVVTLKASLSTPMGEATTVTTTVSDTT